MSRIRENFLYTEFLKATGLYKNMEYEHDKIKKSPEKVGKFKI